MRPGRGEGDNLLGMKIDFCAYLGDPAYADDSSVARAWRYAALPEARPWKPRIYA
jgi:hypothetical protein